MKKLLTILTLLFVTVAAQAYNGGSSSATATFNCQVIEMLEVQTQTAYDFTDQEIVAGTTRDMNEQIPFTITGEDGYDISVTTHGEWQGGTGEVSFKAGSGFEATPTTLGSSGTATFNFEITGVTATASAQGEYTYEMYIEVQYSGI